MKIGLYLVIFLTVLLNSPMSQGYNNRLDPTVIKLGSGWANNTINTVIFRSHGIITRGEYQFTAYYDNDSNIVLIRRSLKDGTIIRYSITTEDINTNDAHNSISIGLDSEGYVHLAYDHHVSQLNYRRSLNPYDITQWTDKLRMTGVLENKVTYPTFIMSPKNEKDHEGKGELLFLYRYGSSGNGDAVLKAFDSKTKSWSDRSITFIKGMDQSPWTSNPYWNHPTFDNQGNLILSYVWRVKDGGPEGLVNNVNISYLRSPDNGQTWLTSKGKGLRTPITQVNGEVIHAVSPGTNLINQTSSAVDKAGNLHIAYYTNDENGIPQYQHLWFNGKTWTNSVISKRTEPFELKGSGTLQIPISRPEMLIDHNDYVYIVYRGDFTDNKLVVQRLTPPDYRPKEDVRILWNKSLGYSEPVVDKSRWQRDGILSMLIQKNYQPNRDTPESHRPEPVYIMEWDIISKYQE